MKCTTHTFDRSVHSLKLCIDYRKTIESFWEGDRNIDFVHERNVLRSASQFWFVRQLKEEKRIGALSHSVVHVHET